MSQNHNHDKNLLGQIERAAHEKQVSGQPALDDLARTIPMAKATFQQQLENDLVAHLQSHSRTQQEDIMESMHVSPSLNRPMAHTRGSIPVTLVATLIMVIFGGSMLLVLRSPQQGVSGAVMQATASPTAIPTETLDSGNLLPAILGVSPITVVPTIFPSAKGVVASLDVVAVYGGPGASFSVVARLIPGTEVEVSALTANDHWLYITTQDGRQGWIAADQVWLDSEQVDVLTVTETNVPPEITSPSTPGSLSEPVLWPVIIARQNIRRGEIIAVEMLGQVYMPSSIAPENTFSQIESLVGLAATVVIQPWQPVLSEQVTAEFQAGIMPDGTVGITIPVKSASDLEGIEVGSNVDVIIAMLVAETAPSTGEAISDTIAMLAATPRAGEGDSVTQFQSIVTTLPGQLLIQRLVQNAPVIRINGGTGQSAEDAVPLSVTLAVDPEEAIALKWLIEADVSFLILRSDIS